MHETQLNPKRPESARVELSPEQWALFARFLGQEAEQIEQQFRAGASRLANVGVQYARAIQLTKGWLEAKR